MSASGGASLGPLGAEEQMIRVVRAGAYVAGETVDGEGARAQRLADLATALHVVGEGVDGDELGELLLHRLRALGEPANRGVHVAHYGATRTSRLLVGGPTRFDHPGQILQREAIIDARQGRGRNAPRRASLALGRFLPRKIRDVRIGETGEHHGATSRVADTSRAALAASCLLYALM